MDNDIFKFLNASSKLFNANKITPFSKYKFPLFGLVPIPLSITFNEPIKNLYDFLYYFFFYYFYIF